MASEHTAIYGLMKSYGISHEKANGWVQVYFIGFLDPLTDQLTCVKIGLTQKTVESRMRTLATNCPGKLCILAVLNNAKPDTERELHTRFADSRLQKEWFRHESPLSNLISDIACTRQNDHKFHRIR